MKRVFVESTGRAHSTHSAGTSDFLEVYDPVRKPNPVLSELILLRTADPVRFGSGCSLSIECQLLADCSLRFTQICKRCCNTYFGL